MLDFGSPKTLLKKAHTIPDCSRLWYFLGNFTTLIFLRNVHVPGRFLGFYGFFTVFMGSYWSYTFLAYPLYRIGRRNSTWKAESDTASEWKVYFLSHARVIHNALSRSGSEAEAEGEGVALKGLRGCARWAAPRILES